jgi:hypothetical protein
MECNHCSKSFEFIENPPNAFVGYLNDRHGKAMGDEVTLCKRCYYWSLMGHTELYPRLYSYPMAYRAKHIPEGVSIPRNGLGRTGVSKLVRDRELDLDIRTAYARALGLDVSEIPPIPRLIKQ